MNNEAGFLLEDVYDFMFENDFSIGTNFCDEFPDSWVSAEDKAIYLVKQGLPVYKITIEEVTA